MHQHAACVCSAEQLLNTLLLLDTGTWGALYMLSARTDLRLLDRKAAPGFLIAASRKQGVCRHKQVWVRLTVKNICQYLP